MPYCIEYGCDNDTHDAPREVSFHRLALKKPTLLKQVSSVHCSIMKCEITTFSE